MLCTRYVLVSWYITITNVLEILQHMFCYDVLLFTCPTFVLNYSCMDWLPLFTCI